MKFLCDIPLINFSFYKKVLLLISLFLINKFSFSQYNPWVDYSNNNLIFTLGYNIVDDDGRPFSNLFNFSETLNYTTFPNRLGLEKSIANVVYLKGILQYNQYKPGTLINNRVNQQMAHFFAVDFFGNYKINSALNLPFWFDPFVGLGLGYTLRLNNENTHAFMLGFSGGTNIWLSDNFAIQIESLAKFSIPKNFPRNNANYLQHSISLAYKKYTFQNREKIKRRYKWIHRKP